MTIDTMTDPAAQKIADKTPDCRDQDEDCDDIPDKVGCYLYDPSKGFCPYLRKAAP